MFNNAELIEDKAKCDVRKEKRSPLVSNSTQYKFIHLSEKIRIDECWWKSSLAGHEAQP